MPDKYKCKECGNPFPEDLIDYLGEGNQVFCEKCGSPFILVNDRIKKRKEVKENLISPENLIKGQKILIGIILLNFFLVVYFFVFLTILFNPFVFIRIISHYLLILKLIGIFIFIFIMVGGFLEIGRGFKLFKNEEYNSQILMVNTIGQVLLRIVLYPPSREENKKSIENEIKVLKILIPVMYVNFFLVNFYYSLPYNNMVFILQIQFFLFIYIIICFFHLSIGFIIFLKVKKLRYRFLKTCSIVQLIFYNIIIVLSIGNLQSIIIFVLLLDASFLYLTIRIIKNKADFIYYFSPKNRVCHKCGSVMKKGIKNCPKCVEDLSKSKIDSEEVPVKKIEELISSNNYIPEKEVIIAKRSTPKETPEGSEYSENLTFVKDEKDKKLLEQYLLERFVVVSKQLRELTNKLNLSREEKIDLLKDFSFLTSIEQQNLLDLLVHLCND